MKLNKHNKYLNVSCNYLNHIQKTVRTFTGRNKKWFESPLLFIFLNFFLEFQNDMSCNSPEFGDGAGTCVRINF